MTDLERRALLGDREAQEECTRQGIVLPCQCGGEAKFVASDPFLQFWWVIRCTECGTQTGSRPTDRAALAAWNTRQAPPLGRCETCSRRETEHVAETCDGEKLYDCELMYEPVSLSGFCDGYKSEEEEN